jgi:hypothetical protein
MLPPTWRWLALFGLCYGGGGAYGKWLRPRRQDRGN